MKIEDAGNELYRSIMQEKFQTGIFMTSNWDSQNSKIQNRSLIRETLSPQVIDSIVERLGWFCMICGVIAAVIALLERRLEPALFEFAHFKVSYLSWVGIFLVSAAMGAVCRLRLLSPINTLKLGMAYEIFVAFGISISETAVSLANSVPVLGISRLALWILAAGVVIPNKPRIKLTLGFLSASTWPLAYALTLHVLSLKPLPTSRLWLWLYVPYLMAFLSYFISKRIYVLTADAENARELGSYHLVSRIGSGGMGEVWVARHSMLARDSAIKLIRNDLMLDQPGYQAEIIRERFKREAQAIAFLQSPYTVQLFDFGISQNGSFYFVMELLDGISLQLLVEKFGPMPASRLIHMMEQVCKSLEEAHNQGLVHRDIKPSNLFVCKVGLDYDFMKVLDFGLAKNVRNALQLTQDGTSAGTPAYMAPEVALGEQTIDHTVDIYSLGCTAYYALTGSHVFSETTLAAMAMAHVQKDPVPPSQRSEMHIPAKLDQIILKCLAKHRQDRIGSARELRKLLKDIPIPPWTQYDAASWWETYLPASSSFRSSRQANNVETLSYDAEPSGVRG